MSERPRISHQMAEMALLADWEEVKKYWRVGSWYETDSGRLVPWIVAVWAIQLESDVEIETRDGWFPANKGDYLVMDTPRIVTGWPWPMKKKIFESTYSLCAEKGRKTADDFSPDPSPIGSDTAFRYEQYFYAQDTLRLKWNQLESDDWVFLGIVLLVVGIVTELIFDDGHPLPVGVLSFTIWITATAFLLSGWYTLMMRKYKCRNCKRPWSLFFEKRSGMTHVFKCKYCEAFWSYKGVPD